MKWTEEEILIAAGMKRAGITLENIAKRLGRTRGSVAVKTVGVGVKVGICRNPRVLQARRSIAISSENDLCNE